MGNLDEVKALNGRVLTADKNAGNYLKVLNAANEAAQKMTTHADADAEVAALRTRFDKVNITKDEWVKKVDVLLKEWTLLDNTVNELNSWVVKDKTAEGENTFSLEKMESTLCEPRISSRQRKPWCRVCKIYLQQNNKLKNAN